METKPTNTKEEKGESGEDYVDEVVKMLGYKVIKFHWWQRAADRILYKDGNSILTQVKYKEPRKYYPDTGLERHKYLDLKRMCAESGIKGMILFTDKSGKVYGDWLDQLKDEERPSQYNAADGVQMIYFKIEDLKQVQDLLK